MIAPRTWIVFTVLLACPTLGSAQLHFAQPTVDLGELRGGPVVQHRFEFNNDSAAAIEILEIRLGCGCLRPVLDQRVYQPGEKGTLLMHIRTIGQPNGARTWQAFVPYRQGEKLVETGLIIAAKIRNDVTVEPSIIAMTIDTTLRQEVMFTDHRALPTKVVAVLASSPAIRVKTEAQGSGITKIVLEVSRAALTAERQEESLNIYTDDPNYRPLQVPITLTKAARTEVSASPDKVEITGSGSRLVRLRATGDKVARIEKAVAEHPAVKCTWAPGPGNDATLKISVNAQLLTVPSASVEVRVQMAEPAPVTLTIPVTIRKE